jgi:hypothetical protein
MTDSFDRRTSVQPTEARAPSTPDPAFAARARLARLRDALTRAAKTLRPARWNEPAVFFFDRKRQAELEAARPVLPGPFPELTNLIADELHGLVGSVEVRRVARATDGLREAASALASRCRAARELVELLAVPEEVFLALAPGDRKGVRLYVRGATDVAQFHRLVADALGVADNSFQLLVPAALKSDGTLPTGFAGCEHWLWPTQPLAAIPRIGGERVVLVGPAVVRAALNVELRFPGLVVECETVQTLNAFQTAEALSRLCGTAVPVQAPAAGPNVARAA